MAQIAARTLSASPIDPERAQDYRLHELFQADPADIAGNWDYLVRLAAKDRLTDRDKQDVKAVLPYLKKEVLAQNEKRSGYGNYQALYDILSKKSSTAAAIVGGLVRKTPFLQKIEGAGQTTLATGIPDERLRGIYAGRTMLDQAYSANPTASKIAGIAGDIGRLVTAGGAVDSGLGGISGFGKLGKVAQSAISSGVTFGLTSGARAAGNADWSKPWQAAGKAAAETVIGAAGGAAGGAASAGITSALGKVLQAYGWYNEPWAINLVRGVSSAGFAAAGGTVGEAGNYIEAKAAGRDYTPQAKQVLTNALVMGLSSYLIGWMQTGAMTARARAQAEQIMEQTRQAQARFDQKYPTQAEQAEGGLNLLKLADNLEKTATENQFPGQQDFVDNAVSYAQKLRQVITPQMMDLPAGVVQDAVAAYNLKNGTSFDPNSLIAWDSGAQRPGRAQAPGNLLNGETGGMEKAAAGIPVMPPATPMVPGTAEPAGPRNLNSDSGLEWAGSEPEVPEQKNAAGSGGGERITKEENIPVRSGANVPGSRLRPEYTEKDGPVPMNDKSAPKGTVAISEPVWEEAKRSTSGTGTLAEIRTFAEKYLKPLFDRTGGEKNYAVDHVTFHDAPYVVTVYKNAINKIISDYDFGVDKVAVFLDLGNVLKGSTYVGSGKNIKFDKTGNAIPSRNNQVVRHDYFKTKVILSDGKPHTVQIDVEVNSSENKYRTHHVLKNIELVEDTSAPGIARNDRMSILTSSIENPSSAAAGWGSSVSTLARNNEDVNKQAGRRNLNSDSGLEWAGSEPEVPEQKNAAGSGDVKFFLDPDFPERFGRWIANGKQKFPGSGKLHIGTTSDALKSIGVEDYSIYWSVGKIAKIMNDHPEMTADVIKSVPDVLENPILVMRSQTVPDRITLFGETVGENGKPVLVVLDLSPKNKRGEIMNFAMVASAYGKNGAQSLIDSSDILYVDPNKKRTNNWLRLLRLQLPSRLTSYGSLDNVSYAGPNVNGNDSFQNSDEKTSMRLAFEQALQSATGKGSDEKYPAAKRNGAASEGGKGKGEPGNGQDPDESERRVDGLGAGGARGGVAEGAGRGPAADTARAAGGRQRLIDSSGAEWVSPESLGLPDGNPTQTVRVFPEASYDRELRDAAALAREHELEARFVSGMMIQQLPDGSTRRVFGFIRGNRITADATSVEFSPTALTRHEVFHAMARSDLTLVPGLIRKLRQTHGEEEIQGLVDAYAKNLRDRTQEELSESDLLEEILADMYGGMNRFRGADAKRYSAEVGAWADSGRPRGTDEEIPDMSGKYAAGLAQSTSTFGDLSHSSISISGGNSNPAAQKIQNQTQGQTGKPEAEKLAAGPVNQRGAYAREKMWQRLLRDAEKEAHASGSLYRPEGMPDEEYRFLNEKWTARDHVEKSAEFNRTELLRNLPREQFRGTPAMEKLGIRIDGTTVEQYGDTRQMIERDKAAKSVVRERRKAERRLDAPAAEREFAKGIAAGLYGRGEIPESMDPENVMELADYYMAERAQGEDLIRARRKAIARGQDRKMELLFRDSNQYRSSRSIVLNHRTPQRNLRTMFGNELGDEISGILFDPVTRNEAERIRFVNRQFDEVRTFAGKDGAQEKLTKRERALTQQMIEGKAAAELAAGMETGGNIQAAAENIRGGMDPVDAAREMGHTFSRHGQRSIRLLTDGHYCTGRRYI